jgi:hypothetical protein
MPVFTLAAAFVRLVLRTFRPHPNAVIDPYPDDEHRRIPTFADDMV